MQRACWREPLRRQTRTNRPLPLDATLDATRTDLRVATRSRVALTPPQPRARLEITAVGIVEPMVLHHSYVACNPEQEHNVNLRHDGAPVVALMAGNLHGSASQDS